MSDQSNVFELNAKIAALVDQYLSLDVVGDAKRLRKFVRVDSLETFYLDQEEARLLAYAVIVAEFQVLRARGQEATIETQADQYCELFARENLNRPELLKRLIQCELHSVENSPLLLASRDALQRRFPEIADFFDEYFDRRRQAVYSRSAVRFPSTGDAAKTPPAVVSTSERYELDLAPLENDAAQTLGKLGAGGLKDVYAARQTSTGQTVALKILKHSAAEARELFKSEVLIQSKLAHPNIPQIFSFDENGVAPTLVERLIPGKSWAEVFDQRSFEENLATLATVSQIVAYAHERKRIIHGDLKPDNVMLGESGGRYNEVYLVDWGSALALDDEGAKTRSIGGTLDYQPPETFESVDLELSFATDVFMLGGVLFQILTGVAPYYESRVGASAHQALEAAQKALVPPIPEVNKKTQTVNPPELIEIASKALRYNPSERYPNAGAFYDALERYRRRANLGERLRVAETAFANLRQEVANAPVPSFAQKIASKLVGRSGAFDATRLIETTNELRLLREEAARSDGDDRPSTLFWNAARLERAAYRFACDSTLKSKDFGVVRSLLEAAEKLEAALPAPSAPLAAPAPVETESKSSDLGAYRSRLNRGLRTQTLQRGAVVGFVFATLAVLSVGGYAWKTRANLAETQAKAATVRADLAKSQAEAAIVRADLAESQAETQTAQIQAIEQAGASVADANWDQGVIALRASAPTFKVNATKQHLAERSGVFLEAVSPRRSIINSVAFSNDEKYLATLTAHNAVTVYSILKKSDAEPSGFASVAQFQFASYNGERRLLPNPMFVDENSETTELASRFLLCRDDGRVFFLRFDETGATTSIALDFRASEPAQGRAAWGTPRLARDADGKPFFIVADASGAASFYSLPDGRLLRKIQLCDAVDNATPVVAATPDGRTIFCAAPDGSFKRWSAESDAVETLDLPLADVDLSLGALLRALAVSDDGQTLYASDETGAFVVWNVAEKKPIYVGQEPVNPAQGKRLEVPETTNFISQIHRLDADRFLTLAFNDRWRVWDLSKRDANGAPTSVELLDANDAPRRGVRAVALSPSRRHLAIADNSFNFELYNLETSTKLANSEGVLVNAAPVLVGTDVVYHPQTDRLIVGMFDYSPVASLDPKTMRVATDYVPYPDPKHSFFQSCKALVGNFAISKTSDEFAAAFCSGDLFFFKDGVSEPIGRLPNAFADASAKNPPLLAASPNGSRLAGKTMNGDELILWDWKARTEIKRLRVSSSASSFGLAFVSETELLELQCNGDVILRNVETGETIATLPAPRPNASLESGKSLDAPTLKSFSLGNDRRRLALGFSDGVVAVVNVKTQNLLFTADQFADPLPYRATPVGRLTSVGLFHADNQYRRATGLAWSSDDALLCATFGNGRAVLLETRSFTPLETFVVADAGANSAGALYVAPFFTRDAKLVTFDTHGFMKRWDFRPSPENATFLDEKRGATRLSGTARPNVWASLIGSTLAVKDGEKELWSLGFVESFQRLPQPNAFGAAFLILGKDGLLTPVDETGVPVETDVPWNRGAPEGTPERLAALEREARERATRTVSPEIQAKIERLTEEFLQKYPDGDSPDAEFNRFLAQIEAVSPPPSADEITPTEVLELGFIRVAAAPNGRAFAAIGKKDGALYVLTLAEADVGWRRVANPQDANEKFTRLAFRPDSRELAALEGNGAITFVPFDAAPDAPNDVVWSGKVLKTEELSAINTLLNGAFVYSPSGRFLLQTGAGNYVWVWDVETRVVLQTLELKLYERTRRESLSVCGLAPLRLQDNADAFVVAGSDGVLRFFKYDDSSRFAPVYLISKTTLSDFVETPSNAPTQDEIQRQKLRPSDARRLFAKNLKEVDCLETSPDEQTLYIGTRDVVYTFDLAEIRRNIAALPEYWSAFDAYGATGLRYSPETGFKFIERDRLVPSESAPPSSSPATPKST